MKPRVIVLDALEGRLTPWPARGPLAVHFCARGSGIPIGEYSRNARLLAESVLHYAETFGPDAVWVSSDTWITAEAMGASVASPGPDEPIGGTGEALVRSARDLDGIPPADPSSQGRQRLMLEALWRIVEAIGDEVFVVACFDQSPFSLACAVGGISEVMLRTKTDLPFVDALLERCVEYATAYGRAMGECGAHMLSTGDSPAALVGPELYRELCLPAEQRVFRSLREDTNAKLSLHVCGDTRAILADMVRAGIDVLEIDHLVDIEEACRVVPEDIALWGNVDPVGLLLRSDEAGIRAAVNDLLDRVHAAGRKRFVLSSGCALAPDTPPENLAAFLRAAREWRSSRGA